MNTTENIQMIATPRKAGFANGVFKKLLPLFAVKMTVVVRAN